ncbi:hypothetical protein [Nonomuraea sp. NEAU-A123]|uniref:hypothetical protein n=1 Tax=Nonomuraea sp. NEAU-A123 TaxID=2839649 RepID=UPI001BE46709|nr:hypothetical protein [Nonomuraea sp. NEAU-A123]MBT2232523.1 hypothetical protein [Nonomuraea sp. NEAU-A123]
MMVKRSVAAALTVVMAAAVNVTTGMLTQRWGWAWLAATIVLVTVGAVSQVWLTLADRADRTGGAEPSEGVTVTGDVSGILSTGADATNIQINPPGA